VSHRANAPENSPRRREPEEPRPRAGREVIDEHAAVAVAEAAGLPVPGGAEDRRAAGAAAGRQPARLARAPPADVEEPRRAVVARRQEELRPRGVGQQHGERRRAVRGDELLARVRRAPEAEPPVGAARRDAPAAAVRDARHPLVVAARLAVVLALGLRAGARHVDAVGRVVRAARDDVGAVVRHGHGEERPVAAVDERAARVARAPPERVGRGRVDLSIAPRRDARAREGAGRAARAAGRLGRRREAVRVAEVGHVAVVLAVRRRGALLLAPHERLRVAVVELLRAAHARVPRLLRLGARGGAARRERARLVRGVGRRRRALEPPRLVLLELPLVAAPPRLAVRVPLLDAQAARVGVPALGLVRHLCGSCVCLICLFNLWLLFFKNQLARRTRSSD